MKITVFCTTQFEGFHCWPNAPEPVDFLRSVHRHMFHVRAEKVVNHDDRDVEFIMLKHAVNTQIRELTKAQNQLPLPTWSCETWAVKLLERLKLSRCEVSEEGENGAIVEA